eukprot:m.73701 g.73701  ORF g.73701 m.73701 type:complete len:437 (-) comp16130_c1_seq4:30-1340(-)
MQKLCATCAVNRTRTITCFQNGHAPVSLKRLVRSAHSSFQHGTTYQLLTITTTNEKFAMDGNYRSYCNRVKRTILPVQHRLLSTRSERVNHTINTGSTILTNVTEAIGNTPLVDLSRLVQNSGLEGRILAKLEYLNPGFSKKDRIAHRMVLDALQDGSVSAGDTVVELTSGNTGTGLAIACAAHGLKFIAVMSVGNSTERARMMKALGAEVVLVPQCEDSVRGQVSGDDLARVEAETERIVAQRGGHRLDQFERPGAVSAHLDGTAPEIWKQTDGAFDAFVDFAGSAGSFAGCASYFKHACSKAGGKLAVSCFVLEPAHAAVLADALGDAEVRDVLAKHTGEHVIQGGGYSMSMDRLHLLRDAVQHIDGFLQITDEEATLTARRLAAEEGVFGGFSGGANVAGALQLLKTEAFKGKTVVVLICDSGLKYLSTDLYA